MKTNKKTIKASDMILFLDSEMKFLRDRQAEYYDKIGTGSELARDMYHHYSARIAEMDLVVTKVQKMISR